MKNKHILLCTLLFSCLLLISFSSASLNYKVNNTAFFNIDNSGDINLSGYYYGDGSRLTNVKADSLAPNSVNNTDILAGTITDRNINDSTNLTLGHRLVFTLGGFIQNIISGQIDINGFLNVTGGLNIDNGVLFVNEISDRVGIGTTSPSENFHLANGTFLQTPGDPVLESSLINSTKMNGVYDIYVSGKYAYVVSQTSDSLSIIDITNPSSPVLVGSLIDSTNMNSAQSVHVSGKYAYVIGADSNSLAVVDISNPSDPTLTGVLIDSTNLLFAYKLYVSGKYAYVAVYDTDSLTIVDISNPANPTFAGSLLDSTNMNGASYVYVSGKYAYVTGSISDSLAIVDISDPTNPTLAGSLLDSTNINEPWGVYVSGRYAYIVSQTSDSLAIVDISDPTNPTLAGSLLDPINLNGGQAVYVSGKYAYVLGFNSDSLALIDISDASSPTLVGVLKDSINMNGPYSVYVSGKYAYVGSYNSDSLAVIDIGGIDSPTASIGDLSVSSLGVGDSLDVVNDLSVRGKIAIGEGMYSAGSVAIGEDFSVIGDTNITGDLIIDSNTFFVDSSINSVGIGTTNPNAKLHVLNDKLLVGNFNNVIGNRLTIDAAGNIRHTYGLNNGSSPGPNGRFQILNNVNAVVESGNDAGGFFVRNNNGRWAAMIGGGSVAGGLKFYTGGTSSGSDAQVYDTLSASLAMTIDQNGNVGIGTATPSHELNVIGDINVTGNYYANGVRGFTGTCVNITYSKGLAITCND